MGARQRPVKLSTLARNRQGAQRPGDTPCKPIAHLGWHHGLFEFAGRLTQPLEKVDYEDLAAWCAAHPDGEIVTFYTKYQIAAKPELELPYRFGRIIFWRATDLLAAPLPAPPVKADADETPED